MASQQHILVVLYWSGVRSTVQDGTRKSLARAAQRAARYSFSPDRLVTSSQARRTDSAWHSTTVRVRIVDLELPSQDDDMSVAYAPAPAHVFRPQGQPAS